MVEGGGGGMILSDSKDTNLCCQQVHYIKRVESQKYKSVLSTGKGEGMIFSKSQGIDPYFKQIMGRSYFIRESKYRFVL